MDNVLNIKGMSCSHCEARVKKALAELGVKVLNVNAQENCAEVELNNVDLKKIKETLDDIGFSLVL